jgi:hypothetical protein
MLKSPANQPTCEQLLQGFLVSFKLSLIAFTFLLIFIVLFVRAVLAFASAWIACGTALCNWLVEMISLYDGTRSMAAFIATR